MEDLKQFSECKPLSVSDTTEVLNAARKAWSLSHERVRIETTPINGHTQISSIVATKARRIEFVVGEDDPDIWDTLASYRAFEAWQLCALVPIHLLGIAHERLRVSDFQLQGWWSSDDRIHFGNLEIA